MPSKNFKCPVRGGMGKELLIYHLQTFKPQLSLFLSQSSIWYGMGVEMWELEYLGVIESVWAYLVINTQGSFWLRLSVGSRFRTGCAECSRIMSSIHLWALTYQLQYNRCLNKSPIKHPDLGINYHPQTSLYLVAAQVLIYKLRRLNAYVRADRDTKYRYSIYSEGWSSLPLNSQKESTYTKENSVAKVEGSRSIAVKYEWFIIPFCGQIKMNAKGERA